MTVGIVTWPPRNWDAATKQFITDHDGDTTGDPITDFKAACNAAAETSHNDLTHAYEAMVTVFGGQTWVGSMEYPAFELAATSPLIFDISIHSGKEGAFTLEETTIADDTAATDNDPGGANGVVAINQGMTSGKWYVEVDCIEHNASPTLNQMGVAGDTITQGPHTVATDSDDAIGLRGEGRILTGNAIKATDLAADIEAGTRFMMAFDVDNMFFWAGEIRSAPTVDWVGNDPTSDGYPSGGLGVSGNTTWYFGVSSSTAAAADPYIAKVVQFADKTGTPPVGFTYLGQ